MKNKATVTAASSFYCFNPATSTKSLKQGRNRAGDFSSKVMLRHSTEVCRVMSEFVEVNTSLSQNVVTFVRTSVQRLRCKPLGVWLHNEQVTQLSNGADQKQQTETKDCISYI